MLERQACRCGHRFATYEAHMAHAVYKDNRPVRCLDPGEIGLYFDGVEWTHIPQAAPAADEPARKTNATARKTDTKNLVCRTCGTVFAKRPGRGRPPKDCYECRGG